jgi:acid stress-induced BolA-like protein IbaG/YrbA
MFGHGEWTKLEVSRLLSSFVVTPESIATSIRAGLACEHLAIDGDGAHFQAQIVSAAFEGLSRVRRHQLVYGALGERMREEIHALSMQTLTPAEWAAR